MAFRLMTQLFNTTAWRCDPVLSIDGEGARMKRSFEAIERSFYVSDPPVERLIGLPVNQRLHPSDSLTG